MRSRCKNTQLLGSAIAALALLDMTICGLWPNIVIEPKVRVPEWGGLAAESWADSQLAIRHRSISTQLVTPTGCILTLPPKF